MNTVSNRLSDVGQSWRIYFHDIPQSATLAQLWGSPFNHFCDFDKTFELHEAAAELHEAAAADIAAHMKAFLGPG